MLVAPPNQPARKTFARLPPDADPWKASDPEFKETPVESMLNYEPTGKFKDISVAITAEFHSWQVGDLINVTKTMEGTTYEYELHPYSSPIDLEGVLPSVFATTKEGQKSPDALLDIQLAEIRYIPQDRITTYNIEFLMSGLTLALYPARTENLRTELRIRFSRPQSQTMCQRRISVNTWFRSSLLFGFVPWQWANYKAPYKEPFHGEEELSRLVAFLVETCPAPE